MTPDEIKKLRLSLKSERTPGRTMSQDEFSRIVGVSSGGTVWRWENGRQPPSPLALNKLRELQDGHTEPI